MTRDKLLCPECKKEIRNIIKINNKKSLFYHLDNTVCVSKHRFPYTEIKAEDLVNYGVNEKKC